MSFFAPRVGYVDLDPAFCKLLSVRPPPLQPFFFRLFLFPPYHPTVGHRIPFCHRVLRCLLCRFFENTPPSTCTPFHFCLCAVLTIGFRSELIALACGLHCVPTLPPPPTSLRSFSLNVSKARHPICVPDHFSSLRDFLTFFIVRSPRTCQRGSSLLPGVEDGLGFQSSFLAAGFFFPGTLFPFYQVSFTTVSWRTCRFSIPPYTLMATGWREFIDFFLYFPLFIPLFPGLLRFLTAWTERLSGVPLVIGRFFWHRFVFAFFSLPCILLYLHSVDKSPHHFSAHAPFPRSCLLPVFTARSRLSAPPSHAFLVRVVLRDVFSGVTRSL